MVDESKSVDRKVEKPAGRTERIEKGLTQDPVAPVQPDNQLPSTQQGPVLIQEGFTMDTIAPPPNEPPEGEEA